MSEQPDQQPDLGPGTDVTADVDQLGEHEKPATSDPDAFVDDSTLGGTSGENAGGAG